VAAARRDAGAQWPAELASLNRAFIVEDRYLDPHYQATLMFTDWHIQRTASGRRSGARRALTGAQEVYRGDTC
jgi:hypothetical protein